MIIRNDQYCTDLTYEALLSQEPGSSVGETWLDDRGLRFRPEQLVIVWTPSLDGEWLLQRAAVGGVGIKADGEQARVRRWRRYRDSDLRTAPDWLRWAIQAGPAGVHRQLARG